MSRPSMRSRGVRVTPRAESPPPVEDQGGQGTREEEDELTDWAAHVEEAMQREAEEERRRLRCFEAAHRRQIQANWERYLDSAEAQRLRDLEEEARRLQEKEARAASEKAWRYRAQRSGNLGASAESPMPPAPPETTGAPPALVAAVRLTEQTPATEKMPPSPLATKPRTVEGGVGTDTRGTLQGNRDKGKAKDDEPKPTRWSHPEWLPIQGHTLEPQAWDSGEEEDRGDGGHPEEPPGIIRVRGPNGKRRRYNPDRHLHPEDFEFGCGEPWRPRSPPPPAASSATQQPTYEEAVVRPPRHMRRPPVRVTGTMFGGLDPILTNPLIDPPARACFNCWQEGHGSLQCPRPVSRVYCHNCGRRGVDLSNCPRCARAHRDYLAVRFGEDPRERRPALVAVGARPTSARAEATAPPPDIHRTTREPEVVLRNVPGEPSAPRIPPRPELSPPVDDLLTLALRLTAEDCPLPTEVRTHLLQEVLEERKGWKEGRGRGQRRGA